MGAGMTFAEVPIGHIFQFPHCACMLRRVGEYHYQYVTYCEWHVDYRAIRGMAVLHWTVFYDEFSALLEAGQQ